MCRYLYTLMYSYFVTSGRKKWKLKSNSRSSTLSISWNIFILEHLYSLLIVYMYTRVKWKTSPRRVGAEWGGSFILLSIYRTLVSGDAYRYIYTYLSKRSNSECVGGCGHIGCITFVTTRSCTRLPSVV